MGAPLGGCAPDYPVGAGNGQVVFFPYLAFPVSAEALLFAAATAAVAKNISFDAQTGRLSGYGTRRLESRRCITRCRLSRNSAAACW